MTLRYIAGLRDMGRSLKPCTPRSLNPLGAASAAARGGAGQCGSCRLRGLGIRV